MPTLKLKGARLAPATEPEPIEITLAEFRDGARPEAGRFALALPSDAKIAEVAQALSPFAAVILEFPTFRDGRAYSQARLLRERYGFAGEIRARGNILRDQVQFMARSGIDAFDVPEAQTASFEEALAEFAHYYQPAADGAAPVWRLREARECAQVSNGRLREARECAQVSNGRLRGRAA